MLSHAYNLTNAEGQKFINTWVLGYPVGGPAAIVDILNKEGNFFIAVVKHLQGYTTISLPKADTDCLPTFYGSLQHLKKSLGVDISRYK